MIKSEEENMSGKELAAKGSDSESKDGKQEVEATNVETESKFSETPIEANVEWKKMGTPKIPGKRTRARRRTRKPNWLGQNVMISKVEKVQKVEPSSEIKIAIVQNYKILFTGRIRSS